MSAEEIAVKVGATIAERRKECGGTQSWLADRLGVGQATVAKIETGRHAPSLDLLCRIADALECTATALLMGVEAESDAYRKGVEDGWRACAQDVEAHLSWKPKEAGR